eukprot:TRINITY_DN21164_c0_g1_i1.p2 TRINITY_DN21164_c0_g1~~TRINITY_DN21164_c0_g1_i1.p2  ORF type:complete len:245 (+),score=28.43 TRINITY_DN21164_c0_g1_i1:75-737(+)
MLRAPPGWIRSAAARSLRGGPGQRGAAPRRGAAAAAPEPSPGEFTHVAPGTDEEPPRPAMVDISAKQVTQREAAAVADVTVPPLLAEQMRTGGGEISDEAARIAVVGGRRASRNTARLVPFCHPLGPVDVDVTAELVEGCTLLRVTCVARTEGKTGVEMEALAGGLPVPPAPGPAGQTRDLRRVGGAPAAQVRGQVRLGAVRRARPSGPMTLCNPLPLEL